MTGLDLVLVQRLRMLSDLLVEFKDRLVIEDRWGQKYDLVRARPIGARTDDPGVVAVIQEARDD